MPGYVMLETTVFEDLGDGRTRVVNTSLFYTTEERDGMRESGMEEGLNQSYAAHDRLLATLREEGSREAPRDRGLNDNLLDTFCATAAGTRFE